ncbi:MAG: TolC family protein [Magnetococcus sp. DMHC-1]
MKAQLRQDEIKKDLTEIRGPIPLAEAMARSFMHNLDHRVKMMEEAISLQQLDLGKFDLLPRLTAQAGYVGRSKFSASSSTDMTGKRVEDFSYSQERDRLTGELTTTWNILDFGLSYTNALQQADRNLVARERRRKVIHNLMQEVRSAYWRTASSQKLRDQVTQTIAQAEKALLDSKKAEAENIKNPIEVLRFQRTLLETIRQLESIDQELSSANTELSVLMGVPPGSGFTVVVPENANLRVPDWEMTVIRMEELALSQNPDLREQAYQERISTLDTRKAILKLLPGISFNLSQQYDSNAMSKYNQWVDAGARISFNLFSIFSAPAELATAETGERLTTLRAQAMQMATLAQTHIALRQFAIARHQYERASQLFELDERILRHSQVREAHDAQSTLERISNQTTMIVGLLRRYLALAQVHAALGRIHATIGQDPLPESVADNSLPALTRLFEKALSDGQPAGSSEKPVNPS